MTQEETIDAVRKRLRLKHMALSTEKTYTHWVRRFCVAILHMPREWSSERKIETFLTQLAKSGCSASTQNQAFNAVLFLYREVLKQQISDIDALRAKRRHVERYTPSVNEVQAILEAAKDAGGYPTRLIMHMLYGCGLRVSEPLNLRIRDVRMDDSQLIIRDPKHGKDRVVAIPCALVFPLQRQMAAARLAWHTDRQHRIPVALPDRLDKKYAYAGESWQWFWLFPALGTCTHPRTGKRVRYRCLEGNVQRACRVAARSVGLDGVTPHCFRHSYATHTMRHGSNVRDVQAALGHKSLETTMGYLHPHCESVRSPLDAMMIDASSAPAPLQFKTGELRNESNRPRKGVVA